MLQEFENIDENNNPYQDYINRPRLIRGDIAIQTGILEPLASGDVIYRPSSIRDKEKFGGKILISAEKQYDLAQATLLGLNEVLVPGTELAQSVVDELNTLDEASENPVTNISYGVQVFYPHKKELVRFTEPKWHRLALVVSNSELYNSPDDNLSWEEVRHIFDETIVAIPGCSVGNNAAFSVISDLRPKHVKVADYKDAHTANANRVRWSYSDIGRNKASVTAEQIHFMDPYINISVYADGINQKNISDFVGGNSQKNEPKPNIIIEETDDPFFKIRIREKAREEGVPVVMVSDVGSAVQLDIRRFDLDPSLSLAVGVPDEVLYKRSEIARTSGDKSEFYDFVFSMLGTISLKGEFRKIVLEENDFKKRFGSTPQLGSTASFAGGWAAATVARMRLGWPQQERTLINLNEGEIIKEGNIL